MYDPYTAIPLSSGIPGITIESEPVAGNFSLVRYNVAIEKLTIGPELYDVLQVMYFTTDVEIAPVYELLQRTAIIISRLTRQKALKSD